MLYPKLFDSPADPLTGAQAQAIRMNASAAWSALPAHIPCLQ